MRKRTDEVAQKAAPLMQKIHYFCQIADVKKPAYSAGFVTSHRDN